MEIRKLMQSDDRLAISHIYEESWKYAYKGIIPQSYLDSIPQGCWAPKVDQEGIGSLLLLDDDILIGTSSYCRSRWNEFEGWGEIISIYLLPQYMGKGYGRHLLNAVVDGLKKQGYGDIFLWVLEENMRARRFYEKCGLAFSGYSRKDNIGGKELVEMQYKEMTI